MRRRLASMPLLWRVFVTNAAVLALATAVLAVGPFTVSVPIALTELLVLLAGVAVMLVLNLLLLRPAFAQLHGLAEMMRQLDPLNPGRRAPVAGEPDMAALAVAFNEMLHRLERERRESARRALMMQEDERKRIARELHDEVGQTLTAIKLQIEMLSPACRRSSTRRSTICARQPGPAPRTCGASPSGCARRRWTSLVCAAPWRR